MAEYSKAAVERAYKVSRNGKKSSRPGNALQLSFALSKHGLATVSEARVDGLAPLKSVERLSQACSLFSKSESYPESGEKNPADLQNPLPEQSDLPLIFVPECNPEGPRILTYQQNQEHQK